MRDAADAPDAGRILYRNVYGWFEPAGRDLYRLTDTGVRELAALGAGAEVDLCAAAALHADGGRAGQAISGP